jgi:hypothetical protein
MPLNPISMPPHLPNVMMHPTNKFSPIPQAYQMANIGSAIVPPMGGGGIPNPQNFQNKQPQFDNKQRIDKLFNTKS